MSTDYTPRVVSLRDGRELLLRPTTAEDAASMREMVGALIADGRGMVLLADERKPEETVASGILDFRNDPASLQLGAFDGPHLAGTADLRVPGLRMIAHNGVFTLGIHPGFQGSGLGRLLSTEVIAWAEARGVERIDLYVLADNERAIQLYRSLGFEVLARREAFLRRPDGTTVDDLFLTRWRPPTQARTGPADEGHARPA